MTAAHRPIRHAGVNHDDEYDPQSEVEACRAKVDSLRRAVLPRKAGASALAVAEYELHRALERLP